MKHPSQNNKSELEIIISSSEFTYIVFMFSNYCHDILRVKCIDKYKFVDENTRFKSIHKQPFHQGKFYLSRTIVTEKEMKWEGRIEKLLPKEGTGLNFDWTGVKSRAVTSFSQRSST